MFLGEFFCLFLYYLVRWARYSDAPIDRDGGVFNPLIFLPAALIDLVQMALFFLGIKLVHAAQVTPFQLMKGVTLIFVTLLSVAFMGLSITKKKWVGVFLIVCGLVIVGLPNLISINDGNTKKQYSVIAGELFIAMSQMLAAVQMIYEEYWISRCNVLPLAVVGWEGLFGTLMASGMLVGFYHIKATNFNYFHEDTLDALQQIGASWQIALAVLGTMLCFAAFRFAGVTLTKQWNATTRVIYECFITVFIWIILVPKHWENKLWYTPFGLILVIAGFGTFYSCVLLQPFCSRTFVKCTRRENDELLLPTEQEVNTCVSEIA